MRCPRRTTKTNAINIWQKDQFILSFYLISEDDAIFQPIIITSGKS
jgi:hypothetical protein